jgi:hypothetical protein
MGNWQDILKAKANDLFKRQQILLLSAVPKVLADAGISSSDFLQGRRLKAAIEVDAKGDLKLIHNPDSALEWAVVPNEILNSEILQLFKSRANVNLESPQLQKWFYAAFVKILPANHRRFVLEGGFEDRPSENAQPPNGFEILETEILENVGDAKVPPTEVVSAAQKWCARQNLQISNFKDQGPSELSSTRLKSKNILDLRALTDSDLKRIVLPLDIVLKIFG